MRVLSERVRNSTHWGPNYEPGAVLGLLLVRGDARLTTCRVEAEAWQRQAGGGPV